MPEPSDPNRCVFCGVDVSLAETGVEIKHTADCPQTTRIWPVHSHDRNDLCTECGKPFEHEEFYASVPVRTDSFGDLVYDSASDIAVITCPGCAAAIGMGVQEIAP